MPEETVDAERLVLGSTQVTAVIAVAGSIVRPCVAVRVDCTWEVAVTVTTLLVGTVAGAVYNPPLSIDPVPVPTDGPIHQRAAFVYDGGRALRSAKHSYVGGGA